MLQNEYLPAKIGVDTAENKPLKVWGSLTYLTRNLKLSKLAVGSIHAGGVLCSNLRGFLDGRTVVGCGSIGRLYVIQFSLVAFRCLVRGVTSGSDEALGAAG